MRYLRRFRSAAEATPVERAVADVVCRLILLRKPMERGSDLIRMGASAAGGLLVWSDYVLDRIVEEVGKKSRRGADADPDDDWLPSFLRAEPKLPTMKVSGDSIGEPDLYLSELLDPDELATLSNDWFAPLIKDYPLRSRLARDTLQWLGQAAPAHQLPHQTNAAYLADGLGLDAAGARLLELIGLCIAAPALSRAFASIEVGDFKRTARVLADLFECTEADIESLYRPDSLLRRCGVLDSCQDPGGRHHHSTLDDLLACHNTSIRASLTRPFDSAQAFFASFLAPAPPTRLNLPDVQHLDRFTELALPTLRHATAQGAPGLNIMLYGPPGTGKTEYAKLLAREAGLQLFEVACSNEEGTGMSPSDRLGSLMLALQSLKGRRDAMVLLDEAEDVFPVGGHGALFQLLGMARMGGRQDQGKAWMHRLLEQMAVPVIWTTNTIDAIDPATLRRFSLILKMGEPPRSVKRRLAEQYLGALNLPAGQLDAIAALPALTPGHLETTARTVSLAAPESPEQASAFVDQQLTHARRALGLPVPLKRRDVAIPYDIRHVNLCGSHNAETLLPALSRTQRAALCFYGVPGTGKTEFGHHIAKCLRRELIVRSGSDLLSPWVGQTEQLIAQMFEEAADRADEVVLLLDEADTLLGDRSHARASWEISHTNEFLAQMESFPGLFICTTNLMDRLDAAVLRRFQFRLEFEALRADQVLALFVQTFGREATPGEEMALQRLAGSAVPADFANIARVLRMTPELLNGDGVGLLQEEVRSRRGLLGSVRAMGFMN
ncbi:MAG TPA: AAA family ATPase [Aquabacterium sp.]|nr:AAA family ATPase [Aquabacterium sp.]